MNHFLIEKLQSIESFLIRSVIRLLNHPLICHSLVKENLTELCLIKSINS